ncbi:uncharacterized protein BDV14DRAFT_73429 [Aspergillus stella-maris]|uniref:uncharacterized protein n=1 Tax=Aspergillus stella-maris TaxID=1810926 RepID=UPI003CCD9BDD
MLPYSIMSRAGLETRRRAGIFDCYRVPDKDAPPSVIIATTNTLTPLLRSNTFIS